MKNILIIFFFLLAIIPAITASGDGAPYTFTLQNNTSVDLGSVLVDLADSTSDTLEVSGYGTFAIQLEAQTTSITINNQTVTYPVTGVITLANGTHLRIRWQSQAIVIVDQNEM